MRDRLGEALPDQVDDELQFAPFAVRDMVKPGFHRTTVVGRARIAKAI